MQTFEPLMHGIRCLQQLAGAAGGMTAAEIARAEGLGAGASQQVLERLLGAGVIEPVPGAERRYRLAHEPAEIRLSEVREALGAAGTPVGLHPRVTLEDLLGWESSVFESAEIPHAA